MKKTYIYLISALVIFQTLGQRPYINSISPTSANVNELVTISGSGFSTNTADLNVFFGAVEASIVSSTDNLIEVTIPAGATYDELFVVNLSSGLTASSSEKFAMAYGGDTFDGQAESVVTGVFQDLAELTTNQNLVYDACLCDFNSDGLSDVVITAQETPSGVAQRLVFRNTSTTTTTSFSLDESLQAQPSSHSNCKDLDGDGKIDLVVSEFNPTSGTTDVEVYRNTTTGADISFEAPQFILVPFTTNVRRPFRIELEDIDSDGKAEIIMASSNNQTVDIYRNTSSTGSVSFNATPSQLTIPQGDAKGIKVADLNNDVLPDLVIIPFEQNDIFIYENLSTSNDINFGSLLSITSGSSSDRMRNVEIADFDNDGFQDIAVTSGIPSSNGRIYILENQTASAASSIAFGSPQSFVVGSEPWGLSVGDLDGDDDVDIAVAMAGAENIIEILSNTSSGATFDFEVASKSVNNNSRNIKIGDINGDAKPDLVFTANSITGQPGFFGFLNNRNCITPAITPSSDQYCPGNTFLISATEGEGNTYSWDVNGSTVNTGTDNTLDISVYNTNLTISVTTTSDDGLCTRQSSNASFTLNTNTPSNPAITPTPSSASVCVGETIALSSTLTADNYFWTGPNGFTGSTQDVTINTDAASAGTYSLVIQQSDGCKSQAATQVVEVTSTPFPKVINTENSNFCDGGIVQLTTNDFNGFSFQWNKDGSAISGETSQDLNVNSTGNYSITLIDQSNTNCRDTSDLLLMQEVLPPVPEITANNEICVDVPLSLLGDTTSGNDQFAVSYLWDFRDSGNSSVGTDNNQNTTFTFTSSGAFTALLSVSYDDIDNCAGQDSQSITVSDPPNVSISTTPNTTIKCPEDSILLDIPDQFLTYTWSTGDNTNSTYANPATGQDSINVSVTATNSVGCTINESITIRNFTDGDITISSPDATVNNGVLTIPEDQDDITLDANGGSNYRWSPGEIFNDTTLASVVATPVSPSTDIILTGLDINGCSAADSIRLVNDKVAGRKSFSPNGDGLGFDCWEILNTSNLDNCTVYIFDSRGRTIFQADSPFPNDCVWDGVDDGGTRSPEGIYYYVLKCDDDQFSTRGSILLAR